MNKMSLVGVRNKLFNKRITEIINRINVAGGRAYLVGGAVRDFLQDRKPVDLDFIVAGPGREWFEGLFPGARPVGRSYTIYRLEGCDFDLSSSNNKDYETELGRRDFTINAMALELKSGEIIDPFNGRKDLEEGIIRALPGAFQNDPLRVYRAARLAAERETSSGEGFRLTAATRKMMEKVGPIFNTIPVERVFEELKKALKSQKPQVFFQVLRESDLLKYHFPELEALIGVKQPEKYHPEGDVFNHTMQSLEAAAARTGDPLIRFCVLVHDLGKALTPEKEWPHHYRHDQEGLKPLKKLCNRLGLPVKWLKAAEVAVTEHMKGYRWQKMRAGKIVKLLERAERSPLGIKGLEIVIESDRRGRNDLLLDVPEAADLSELGERLFSETGGSSITEVEEGPEFGERLFQYRCRWVKEEMAKK